jgi:hypothetical protein
MADMMFQDIYDREQAHMEYVRERKEKIMGMLADNVMPTVLYPDDDGNLVLDYDALGRWYIGTALQCLSEYDSSVSEDTAEKVANGDCETSVDVFAAGLSYGFCAMSLGHDELCGMNETINDLNDALQTCADVIRDTGKNELSPLVVMHDLQELRNFADGE